MVKKPSEKENKNVIKGSPLSHKMIGFMPCFCTGLVQSHQHDQPPIIRLVISIYSVIKIHCYILSLVPIYIVIYGHMYI